MGYFKLKAHRQSLLLYLAIDVIATVLAFVYLGGFPGAFVLVICLLFTVLRLVSDMTRFSEVCRLEEELREHQTGKARMTPPEGRRNEIFELRRALYRLSLSVDGKSRAAARERETCQAMMADLAEQLARRTKDLTVAGVRRELFSLARDMARLSGLLTLPVGGSQSAGNDTYTPAGKVFDRAVTEAGAYLEAHEIRTVVAPCGKACVSGDAGLLAGVMAGVLESCARLVPAGELLTCVVTDTPAFTELSVVCDALPWPEHSLTSVIDPEQGAEPGFVVLSALADRVNGSVQVGKLKGAGMRIGIRFFKNGK